MSKIPLPQFFQEVRKALSYDEVEDLIKNLRRDNREKFDKALFDAGEQTRKTGKKHGVFLRKDVKNLTFEYRFKVYSIEGLSSTALMGFLDQLGTCVLIRETIVTR